MSSTSNALRVEEDEDVGLGGSEGSLPVDVEGEVLEMGEDSELIVERITALRKDISRQAYTLEVKEIYMSVSESRFIDEEHEFTCSLMCDMLRELFNR